MARFQAHQARQIPKAKMAPVVGPGLGGDGVAKGHPLVISLKGRRASGRPGPLAVGLVVFRPALPGIIRRFVIVPNGNQRMSRVHQNAGGIGLVLPMAGAIVRQGKDLPAGLMGPTQACPGRAPVAVLPVLVKVVAKVKHHVYGGVPSDGIVAVEMAKGVIGTGRHGQGEFRHRTHGQGARSPHQRRGRPIIEAIEVAVAGRQPRHQNLHGEILLRAGLHRPLLQDLGEGGIFRQRPGHSAGAALGAHPSPKHHRVIRGIATGDAMTERRFRRRGRRHPEPDPPGQKPPSGQPLHQRATCEANGHGVSPYLRTESYP